MSTPPKAGKRMSVRVDDALSDDLAVLMRTGMTASDAVRLAVGFLAYGYLDLWTHGHYPDGVAPARMKLVTPPHDGRPTGVGRS